MLNYWTKNQKEILKIHFYLLVPNVLKNKTISEKLNPANKNRESINLIVIATLTITIKFSIPHFLFYFLLIRVLNNYHLIRSYI
jgi:hypothetical protein